MGIFEHDDEEDRPSGAEILDMQKRYALHRVEEIVRELNRLKDRMKYYGEGVGHEELDQLLSWATVAEEVLR